MQCCLEYSTHFEGGKEPYIFKTGKPSAYEMSAIWTELSLWLFLDILGNFKQVIFFTQTMAGHWNRLSSEVVGALSLELFNARLDGALHPC